MGILRKRAGKDKWLTGGKRAVTVETERGGSLKRLLDVKVGFGGTISDEVMDALSIGALAIISTAKPKLAVVAEGWVVVLEPGKKYSYLGTVGGYRFKAVLRKGNRRQRITFFFPSAHRSEQLLATKNQPNARHGDVH